MDEDMRADRLTGAHRALREPQVADRIVELAEPEIDDPEPAGDVGWRLGDAGDVDRRLQCFDRLARLAELVGGLREQPQYVDVVGLKPPRVLQRAEHLAIE